MSLGQTLQNIFNTQSSTAAGQTALQNAQGAAGNITTTAATSGLANYPTTVGTSLGQWNQLPYSGGLGQTYQMSYTPPWPTMTLTLKDVALLHRICGEDEEVRAVLNKILPYFKLEA